MIACVPLQCHKQHGTSSYFRDGTKNSSSLNTDLCKPLQEVSKGQGQNGVEKGRNILGEEREGRRKNGEGSVDPSCTGLSQDAILVPSPTPTLLHSLVLCQQSHHPPPGNLPPSSSRMQIP